MWQCSVDTSGASRITSHPRALPTDITSRSSARGFLSWPPNRGTNAGALAKLRSRLFMFQSTEKRDSPGMGRVVDGRGATGTIAHVFAVTNDRRIGSRERLGFFQRTLSIESPTR